MRLAEFSLLQTVSDWSHDSAKSFNEPTIEGIKSVKTSYITNRLRLGTFLNGYDLLRIHRNFISRYYKSEELNL